MKTNLIHNIKIKMKSDGKKLRMSTDKSEDNQCRCRVNLKEYLQHSTLHGLRYVGNRSLSRFERSFFACMFFLVMVLSIYFISHVWMKWSQTPIIITLSSKSESIKNIPFPAVTICNMNQVRKSEAQKYPTNSSEYYVLKSLCRGDHNLNNCSGAHSGSWDKYNEMLVKVAPPCNSMLLYCEFGGMKYNCTSIFTTTLTDDGICCTFNGIDMKFLMKTMFKPIVEPGKDQSLHKWNQWTPETGYMASTNKNERYPRSGNRAGNEMGLTLILNAHINDYFCSATNSQGFKVLLHSPNDIPKVTQYGVAISNGFESRIAIKPTISTSSPAIRAISRDVRQCIFEYENFLSYYSIYSENSCMSECETKLMHKYCDCIMYYQPRIHENISICGIGDFDCTMMVGYEMDLNQNSSFSCDHCVPGCFDISYQDSTMSMAKILKTIPFLKKNNLDAGNISILHVYYTKTTIRSQIKEELVGFTEFLSNTGALLGLFMGFSVISFIEILYYITLRPYCNCLQAVEKKRRSEELKNNHLPIITGMKTNIYKLNHRSYLN